MTQQNNGTGGGGDYEKTDDTVKKLDRLHSANGFQEEVRRLTNELSEIRTKCTLLEKEKSEILLRRFPALENVSSKATGNEFAKLQKTIRELQAKNEGLYISLSLSLIYLYKSHKLSTQATSKNIARSTVMLFETL